MKRLLFGLHFALAAMFVASAPMQALAQSDSDLQPGVVISIANVNEHLSDIEHLMEAAGVGQMAGLVRMGAAEYIRGIDAEKPMGALLFFTEDNPEKPDVLAFVPVTDFEDVLDTLAPFVDIDEDGDDIILTTNDGTEITTRVVDGYAFLAENAELLESLPENPASYLGDLSSNYNIAARVFGQNIPESLRTQAIELIKSGAESEMNNLGDGPAAALQRANFEYSMAQMESFINETEEVIAGLAIDQDGKRIYIDVQVTGLAGSQLAKQSKELANTPATKLGGFLMEDAAANFHMCAKLLEEDVRQVQTMVDNLESAAIAQIDKDVEDGDRTEQEAEGAKKVLGDLINVLRGSLGKGYMDFGGSLVLSDNQVQLAMGLSIAEGAKLEASIKEIAAWAESEGAPVKFDFDVSTKDGVRFHSIKVEIPEDEEEARSMFGENLEILLGVSDDMLYAAAGHNPGDLLSKCMSGKAPTDENLIGQFNMRLLPILKFLSEVQDSPELSGIADVLPEDADDRIRMTVKVVPNGQHFRFEVEDAILKVLTEIGQSMGGGFGPPQDF